MTGWSLTAASARVSSSRALSSPSSCRRTSASARVELLLGQDGGGVGLLAGEPVLLERGGEALPRGGRGLGLSRGRLFGAREVALGRHPVLARLRVALLRLLEVLREPRRRRGRLGQRALEGLGLAQLLRHPGGELRGDGGLLRERAVRAALRLLRRGGALLGLHDGLAGGRERLLAVGGGGDRGVELRALAVAVLHGGARRLEREVAGDLVAEHLEPGARRGERGVGRDQRLAAPLGLPAGLLEPLAGRGERSVVRGVAALCGRRVVGGPAHGARRAVREPGGERRRAAGPPRLLGRVALLLPRRQRGLHALLLLRRRVPLPGELPLRGERLVALAAEPGEPVGLLAPLPRRLQPGARLGGLAGALGDGLLRGHCAGGSLFRLPELLDGRRERGLRLHALVLRGAPRGHGRAHLREAAHGLGRVRPLLLARLLLLQRVGGAGLLLGRVRQRLLRLAGRLDRRLVPRLGLRELRRHGRHPLRPPAQPGRGLERRPPAAGRPRAP